MRKFMYFAAALLVLVGCNKNDNIVENAPEGTPFEKGQQVTLTVGAGAQQGPNRVAGVDNTTDNQIDFKWEENDKILVKVGQNTAEFKLTTGAGSNIGTFSGLMPVGGTTFDIQYPIEEPNLAGQFYRPIPADKMLFTATGCTLLSNEISLTAQYAMVQLNLFGTDKTVGKIVFTNKTANPAVSYTLTCTGGVAIGATSATATPLYMVVPTGTYQFEAEIWDNATTPAKICSFATSAAQTFTAGKCLNMPAKEVKALFIPTYVDLGLSVKWATCNVGATTPEGYGYYLAWGETSPKEVYDLSTYFDYDEETGLYAKYNDYGGLTTLEPADDAATVNWGENWRMPTKAEFEELKNSENCEWVWQEDYNSTGVKGYLVTSLKEDYTDNSIFLPAAGLIDESSIISTNAEGYYWYSKLLDGNSDIATSATFDNQYIEPNNNNGRQLGLTVRPVYVEE
ncbi:MAG: hypothetical protein MJZ58_03475 [Paludibacteraceae bacterium]|nr:hypothetical protein [Paludibacteraceae bacterium]